jgi:outer membrane biosynthesis protein TonB
MRITLFTIMLAGCELASAPALAPNPSTATRAAATAQDVEAAPAEFPARRSAARLPTADALRADLHARGLSRLAARLRLCVNGRGEIAEVRLDEGSGVAGFDAAVAVDVARWRYEPFRAPDGVRVCEPVTIRYLL